jgi:hypothetical protein
MHVARCIHLALMKAIRSFNVLMVQEGLFYRQPAITTQRDPGCLRSELKHCLFLEVRRGSRPKTKADMVNAQRSERSTLVN